MRTHPFDWFSFLFGGVLLIAGVLLVTDTRIGVRFEWAAPAAIVLVGLALLLAAVPRRSRQRGDGAADET